MRCILLVAFIACASAQLQAQKLNKDYDSVLAKKLDADAYGMRTYYLVILKIGTANITDKARLDSIFSGHMKNIQWLASQNKLYVAGPLGKNNNNYEGIFILNTTNKEEAEKMLENDTAIKMNVIAADYYLWYGSAALQEVPSIHKKLAKEQF